MSTLITDKIVNERSGSVLYKSPQAVVQVVNARMDTITTIASSGWTEISGLRLTIAPKFSNSRLIIKFQLFGEINAHDTTFRIHRDGSLITSAGETGYNVNGGNNNWSGYSAGFFDQDQNSTGNKYCILYSQIAGSTTSRYYSVYFFGSDGGNRTWYQNRTIGAVGQTNYENCFSTGQIIEVAQ